MLLIMTGLTPTFRRHVLLVVVCLSALPLAPVRATDGDQDAVTTFYTQPVAATSAVVDLTFDLTRAVAAFSEAQFEADLAAILALNATEVKVRSFTVVTESSVISELQGRFGTARIETELLAGNGARAAAAAAVAVAAA
eukprot:SAG22_NODE_1541_length_4174_cov_3.161227_5_plen_138_part_01